VGEGKSFSAANRSQIRGAIQKTWIAYAFAAAG
jgi:hypothetical protein